MTIVGVVTIGASTYFILYSEQIFERLSLYLSIFERASAREAAKDGADLDLSTPYDAIIVGGGRFGGAIIQGLRDRGGHVLVVDHDPATIRAFRESGVETLYGDAGEPEFAGHLPLHEARSIICAVPDPVANLILLESVRKLGFTGRVCLTALDDGAAQAYSVHPEVSVIRPFAMTAKSVVDQLPLTRKHPPKGS